MITKSKVRKVIYVILIICYAIAILFYGLLGVVNILSYMDGIDIWQRPSGFGAENTDWLWIAITALSLLIVCSLTIIFLIILVLGTIDLYKKVNGKWN